jgi:hypothetical protein
MCKARLHRWIGQCLHGPALSLPMMSFGAPLGAKSPPQAE